MPDQTTVGFGVEAWMTDDGRVATDRTKEQNLPSQVAESFHIPLIRKSDATAALAQKDGEISALREALQRTTHIIDRMGDMPDEFISPGVWRDLKCERAIELARAALGSQA